MRTEFLVLCCMALILHAPQSTSRPVSYPGGWTVMQKNDVTANSLHVHYSPTAKYSIGYRGNYWRKEDRLFHGVQINYLLKRRNAPASQANFYLKGSLGIDRGDSESHDVITKPAAFADIAFDWENRRYFTSYENRTYYAGDVNKFFTQKARVGIAPYIGGYGDLHTWLMLQVDHYPDREDKIAFTPLIRLFKSEYLGEVGISDGGDILFNLIIRF